MDKRTVRLIGYVEAFMAWGLIFLGLWVVTGKWGWAVSEDWWRVTILIACLIIARVSAEIYGEWKSNQDRLKDG